ncbi:MAG: hypothetical protein ACLTR6_12390 [Clostridium fessum]
MWLQKIDYDEQATMVPVCSPGAYAGKLLTVCGIFHGNRCENAYVSGG